MKLFLIKLYYTWIILLVILVLILLQLVPTTSYYWGPHYDLEKESRFLIKPIPLELTSKKLGSTQLVTLTGYYWLLHNDLQI